MLGFDAIPKFFDSLVPENSVIFPINGQAENHGFSKLKEVQDALAASYASVEPVEHRGYAKALDTYISQVEKESE